MKVKFIVSKKLILVCETCLSRNYKTFVSDLNPRSERLILKKYCSKCNKRTDHKETR